MAAPAAITPALWKALRGNPSLPSNTWYFITGVTLSVLNRPDEVPNVFRHAIEEQEGKAVGKKASKHNDQLNIARRLREALIKTVPIAGLPKTINALIALKTATPSHLLDMPSRDSPTSRSTELYGVPSSQVLQRGQEFFETTYGKVSTQVMSRVDHSGTEDLGLVARLMYGYILSNTSVLTAAETSFALIAGLIPQDVNPQLTGHLKGALNNGATLEQVHAVRDAVIKICVAYGMKALDEHGSNGWGWREEVANL